MAEQGKPATYLNDVEPVPRQEVSLGLSGERYSAQKPIGDITHGTARKLRAELLRS